MLVNCVAYQEGARLVDLPVEQISDYLDKPGCFVWVALRDPSPQELDAMRREFDLHPLAVEDASHGHQRPKVDEYGDTLFVVMQLIEFVGGELNVGEVAVFAGPNYVLSVRTGSRQHFLGVRERCEREPQLLKQGSGYVLYALMDAVVDRYFPILELLQTELESIEERIFVRGATRLNIERLYALKRKLMQLEHAVSSLLQFSGKLHGGRVPAVCANTQPYFRDIGDHLSRIEASIDSIRETIGTVIMVNLSMVTIEEGEITKRLAAWAAIFAVATAFAGIWGMNFEVMPELKLRWGYPAALALIVGTSTYLWWRFRRSGWL
ncbi:MAG: magnesium and cobalt transport protein CorA [Rubrivivax sp.]|nr:magnesium and cobalt transport protein CorA [Rubrivivax sp.]